MNWAASSARGSGFARGAVDWLSGSAGSSSARLLLTKRAICSVPRSRCRTQHMPANQFHLPNHRRDSRSTAQIEKKSVPEARPGFLQDAAKADGADLAREPGRIV